MQFAHPYFIRGFFNLKIIIFLILDNPQMISRIKRNCSTPKRTPQINSNNIDDLSNSSIFNLDCNIEASTSSPISAVPAITGGGDRLIAENGEQMMLVAEDELNNIINELQSLRIGQTSLHNKVGDLSRFLNRLIHVIKILLF